MDFPLLSIPNRPIFKVSWWDDSNNLHTTAENEWEYLKDRSSQRNWNYRHKPTGIELSLSLLEDGGVSRWKTNVLNHSKFRISKVTFPDLPPMEAWREGQELIFPGVTSRRIPQPAAHSTLMEPYPRAAMNWIALSKAGGSFYLSREDPEVRLNEIASNPERSGQGVGLSMTQVDAIAPGESTQFVTSMTVQEGDWKAAAVIYRNWFYSHFGNATHSPEIRYGHGFYDLMISQFTPIAYYGENELEIDRPWWFGLSHIQLWGHGPIVQACPNYYLPDPGRGGEVEFRRYVALLKKNGFSVGTYFLPDAHNPLFSMADEFRGIKKADLPEELRPPTFEFYKKHAHIGKPGGSPLIPPDREVAVMEQQGPGDESKGKVRRYFLSMNWSKEWVNYIHFWVDRYRNDYGATFPYFDVLAFRPKEAGYNDVTGFGDGKQAQRMRSFINETLAKQKAKDPDKGYGFMAEGYTDFWANDGIMLLSGFRWAPEIMRYTFPDHILMEGNSNGMWHVPKDRQSIGNAFADGNHLDVLFTRSSLSQIVWLREAIREWLPHTVYRERENIAEAPKGVEVRYHQGDGFGLFTWFQNEPATTPLKLASPGTNVRWFSITDDGKAEEIKTGNEFSFPLPKTDSGVIIAVGANAKLPNKIFTSIRTKPGWDGSTLEITQINVSSDPAEASFKIMDFDTKEEVGQQERNLQSGEVASVSVPVSVKDAPKRLIIRLPGETVERRRLATVPFPDGQFKNRRHFIGGAQVLTDEGPVHALKLDAGLKSIARTLYLPKDQVGDITFTYKATGRAKLNLSMEDEDTGEKWQIPTKPVEENGWLKTRFQAKGNSGWLKLTISRSGEGEIWIRSVETAPAPSLNN